MKQTRRRRVGKHNSKTIWRIAFWGIWSSALSFFMHFSWEAWRKNYSNNSLLLPLPPLFQIRFILIRFNVRWRPQTYARWRQFPLIALCFAFVLSLQELNGSYWRRMKNGRLLMKPKDFARCTWRSIQITSIVHVGSQRRWGVTAILTRCPIHLCPLML